LSLRYVHPSALINRCALIISKANLKIRRKKKGSTLPQTEEEANLALRTLFGIDWDAVEVSKYGSEDQFSTLASVRNAYAAQRLEDQKKSPTTKRRLADEPAENGSPAKKLKAAVYRFLIQYRQKVLD
jgi:hypothetical protein